MLDSKERLKIYYVYKLAKSRCTNKNVPQFKDYGGRGIEFKFTSFEEFLEELGTRPLGYTLDRINNNGHYEKGNVRWATRKLQANNKRIYITNTTGLSGVRFRNDRNVWVSRALDAETNKRKELYVGKDYFEACCARRSWELNQGSQQA